MVAGVPEDLREAAGAMSPRVSVVMPAYNAAWCIGAAASAVLWQTYRDLELVVVDDGSTDGTADVVGALHGPVRLVRQENAGVAAARNRGIEAASGELIAFCDADDLWFARPPRARCSTSGTVTAGSPPRTATGCSRAASIRAGFATRAGFRSPRRQRRAILEQNFVSTMSVFPRALVDEIGPFDEQRRRAEDWDFWLRAIYAGHRVSLQREPLALYRWSDTGLSSGWREMDADIEAIFEGLEERVQLSDDERAYVRRRLSGPGPRILGREGDCCAPRRALRRGRPGVPAGGGALPRRASARLEGPRAERGAAARRAPRPQAAARDRAAGRLRGRTSPVSPPEDALPRRLCLHGQQVPKRARRAPAPARRRAAFPYTSRRSARSTTWASRHSRTRWSSVQPRASTSLSTARARSSARISATPTS